MSNLDYISAKDVFERSVLLQLMSFRVLSLRVLHSITQCDTTKEQSQKHYYHFSSEETSHQKSNVRMKKTYLISHNPLINIQPQICKL